MLKWTNRTRLLVKTELVNQSHFELQNLLYATTMTYYNVQAIGKQQQHDHGTTCTFSLPRRSSTTCLRVSRDLTVSVCHQRYIKLCLCGNIAFTNTAGQPCDYVQLHNGTCCAAQQPVAQELLQQQGRSGPLPASINCKIKTRSLVISSKHRKGRGRTASILSQT